MTTPEATSQTQQARARPRGWVRHLANPRVVLPFAVGIGLLAYVISLATAPQSGAQLWQIVQRTWWIVLLLVVPYLALRALVWHELLEQLGIAVPWRPLLVAFAGGEITKSLPAGVYVQNYLIARLEHFGQVATARSTMASTAMLGLEAALAVPVALLLGWPGAAWVRWTLLGIVVAWVVIVVLAWLLVNFGVHHLPARTPDWVRSVTRFIEKFLEAGGELLAWRTARSLVPTAAYMFIYAVDLYVIVRALGIPGISLLDAVGIYAFVVLTVILVPIPTEIGLTEFTGLMALIAYGIPQPTAAIVILGLRALATGMTIIVSGALLILLRRELSRAQRMPPAKSAPEAQTTPAATHIEEPES